MTDQPIRIVDSRLGEMRLEGLSQSEVESTYGELDKKTFGQSKFVGFVKVKGQVRD